MRELRKIYTLAAIGLLLVGCAVANSQKDIEEPPKDIEIGTSYSCGEKFCRPDAKGSATLIEVEGKYGFVDAGMAYDGPAYIIQLESGGILARCGGFLMAAGAEDLEKCGLAYWGAQN